MNVFANTVVTLSFKLYDSNNQLIEETDEPIAYLHGGHSGIFPKVEAALNAKKVGDTVSVTLEPDDAFGDYDAELMRIEPLDQLPPDVAVGGHLVAEQDGNEVVWRITGIADGKAVLDGNHELAGPAAALRLQGARHPPGDAGGDHAWPRARRARPSPLSSRCATFDADRRVGNAVAANDDPLRQPSVGPAFPADPGADERARPRAARDRPSDDRSSRTGIRAPRPLDPRSHRRDLPDARAGRHLRRSGTGAWEAALVNTLSAGDTVLMAETGHFALLWKRLAERLGIAPRVSSRRLASRRRRRRDPRAARDDRAHAIKAVCVVHNETSTGVVERHRRRAPRDRRRRASGAAARRHDLVARSIDYRHDEWGVDVTVAGSQKGLMLPPGLSFNAVSAEGARGVEARDAAARVLGVGRDHRREPQRLLADDARDQPAVRARCGARPVARGGLAERVRAPRAARRCDASAVRAWGLQILCANPAEYSNSLTAVLMPDGHDADAFRKLVLERFDMSLGTGLSKLAGRVFRIGHLGDFNDLTLMGTLAGVEMGLAIAQRPASRRRRCRGDGKPCGALRPLRSAGAELAHATP